MRAMILAAGLGTRMAPLSLRRPKNALPVLDEPLLLRLVRDLAAQGVERAVVNAHAHPEQVREALSKAPIPVQISHEPELLGSGGGIRQARSFLDGPAPFLVLNADMCVDLDLPQLLETHARLGAIATLVLRDEARKHDFGTIGYAAGARVSRITDLARVGPEIGSGLFAGIQVVEPEVFALMPEHGPFDSMADLYAPMLRRGDPLCVWLQPCEARWWPVGTPRELLDANLRALAEALPDSGALHVAEDARIDGELEGPAWIGPGAYIAAGAHAGPNVVIGAGATLAQDSRARDALLLPGAAPPAGSRLRRAIAFDEEVWRDA